MKVRIKEDMVSGGITEIQASETMLNKISIAFAALDRDLSKLAEDTTKSDCERKFARREAMYYRECSHKIFERLEEAGFYDFSIE